MPKITTNHATTYTNTAIEYYVLKTFEKSVKLPKYQRYLDVAPSLMLK